MAVSSDAAKSLPRDQIIGDIKYTEDDDILNEMETYYSYVLDNMNMNHKDPISANIGFFNNSGKVWPDGPKVGRTLIYMTRPNLNLRSDWNISRGRIFHYTCGSKIGRTVNRFLMYPSIAKNVNYGGFDEMSMGNLGTMVGTCDDGKIGQFGNLMADASGNTQNISDMGYAYHITETPFIPLVSNLCTSAGGAKDITLNTFQTDQNFSGQYLVYPADITESHGPGEIALEFEDIYGSPIFLMFLTWVYYMHYVAKGICFPERAYGVNKIIDSTVSLYILMLDTDMKTIVRWARYAGCFPKGIPTSNILHSKEVALDSLSKVSINMQYNFCRVMDPVDLAEFNMIAETALTCRPGEGFAKASDEEYEYIKAKYAGSIDESRLKSAMQFFRAQDHRISETDALIFRQAWTPETVPAKLIEPANKAIERINDIDLIKSVQDIYLSDRIYGQKQDLNPYIDKGGNAVDIDTLAHSFYDKEKTNGYYFGSAGDIFNYRSPYIVEGNQLWFL